MCWNDGASLAELWGQITQQLWQTHKASCGREEHDASCLVAGVPCPAAVFRQRADREAGSLVGHGLSILLLIGGDKQAW